MADTRYVGSGSWTYGNDPENSTRDEVRFLSGDCVPEQEYLTDTEVAYCIAKEPTISLAAARAAEHIAAKLAREMSMGAEGYSGSLDQRRTHFLKIATDLRKKYGQGVPEVGGLDKTDHESLDDEADIVLIPFRIGMHDHPETYDDPSLYYEEDE